MKSGKWQGSSALRKTFLTHLAACGNLAQNLQETFMTIPAILARSAALLLTAAALLPLQVGAAEALQTELWVQPGQ